MCETIGRLIDDEVLFRPTPGRMSILPILYPEMWTMYKKLQASTWTAEEINFADDISQIVDGLSKDNPKSKQFQEIMDIVAHVLGFFSGADKVVNDNLAENFLGIIEILEAKQFYGMQIQNEGVHMETYAKTIEAYYSDKIQRDKILNAHKHMKCIKKLFDWAQKWIEHTPEKEQDHNPVLQHYELEGASEEVIEDLATIWCHAKRLVAFACIEGVMFSSAFCIIFWFKEKGLFPGLTFSNELISRDEGLHRDFACLLFRMINHKPPHEQLYDIITEAVDVNKQFVDEMLGTRQVGMNADLMNQYVQYTADSLSRQLNMDLIYNVKNPFSFMEKISINGMTNFFEKRVGEYSMAGFEEGGESDIELDDNY